jgi:hypothetical protein
VDARRLDPPLMPTFQAAWRAAPPKAAAIAIGGTIIAEFLILVAEQLARQ